MFLWKLGWEANGNDLLKLRIKVLILVFVEVRLGGIQQEPTAPKEYKS